MNRKLIQDLYVGVCKDSGFTLEWDRAAAFVGDMLGITALEVGFAFPYVERLQSIATGEDPILKG